MIKKIILFSLIFVNILMAVTINSNKNIYKNNEQILVNFSEMTVLNDDWIGIYPDGSTNAWENMIQWEWTDNITEGNITFNALPVGAYEIRAFHNNSLISEASKTFTVETSGEVTTVSTNKEIYLLDEPILTSFSNMLGGTDDWIGIYPEGSTTAWENMVQWEWISAEINGTQTFSNLLVGNYEVRVFFHNSLTMEASHAFSVTENNVPATVETVKDIYLINEQIVTTFDNMSGSAEDWIAIYPAGSTNAWGNMLQWEWVNGQIAGTQTFEALPVGDYEVRVFFNNTLNLEASHAFSVESNEVILTPTKEVFDPQELIIVDFDKMRGTGSDWIGVFTVGTDNEPSSAIQWKYAQSSVSGTLSFNGLAPGTYEIRAFFATLYKKTITFTVQDIPATSTLYEDAQGGFDQVWFSDGVLVRIITPGAAGSTHSIRAKVYASSYFSFPNSDKKMRFLELDTRIGAASHVGNFGVKIKTKNGNRRIIFSSYMNHSTNGRNDFSGNAIPTDPFTFDGYLHNHPGPTDYYLDTRDGTFIHYKINIEEKLRILEPDNEFLGMILFTSAGGDFDNIKLVSH